MSAIAVEEDEGEPILSKSIAAVLLVSSPDAAGNGRCHPRILVLVAVSGIGQQRTFLAQQPERGVQ